jgi:hypothetical protein
VAQVTGRTWLADKNMYRVLALHGFTQNDQLAQSIFGHICNLTTGLLGHDKIRFIFGMRIS